MCLGAGTEEEEKGEAVTEKDSFLSPVRRQHLKEATWNAPSLLEHSGRAQRTEGKYSLR